ncbi:HOS4 protein [Sporothrix schenckii 1099-18]|uniref:HOS4 protein n=1 Tax=Sporothrix schenckii 1099-18 TaxID=1397361 RepID=A0A0F2M9K4_SPOSC|nr:HOS4 protein [Sporothrix schenckii 1099-18]KJR86393.1 HOS4 protein [Sporothrix schenckii 1099-18]
MDAQNASEATSAKPNASSTASASRVSDSQRQKSTSATATSVNRSPTLSRAAPPSSREPKSSSKHVTSATTSSSTKERSRGSTARTVSPTSTRDGRASASSSRDKQDDDGGTDGNSEAETIVLSKDGSPSKPRNRKVIKHEDNGKPNGAPASSAAHSDLAPPSRRQVAEKKDGQIEKRDKADKVVGDAAEGKKKRLHDKLQGTARPKDATSSLSSAPASPPRSRNSSSRPHSGSDSDRGQQAKSPRRPSSLASKDRLRPPEKLVPHKRKAPKVESDDETEAQNARRQRLASAGAGGDTTSHSSSRAAGKDSSRNSIGSNGNANGNGSGSKASASRSLRDASQNRSLSPQPRSHRRSLSTQLQSQSSGLGLKKKRVPAPLQSTDYNSDDSSASGSPHMRSAKLRSLATPATADSATSPAKTSTHKKHLDAHGQTFLARACARGELELVKQRLAERPYDLNVADFAGNTPLQIAALNGYGEIVKFLIDAGCNLDCVNHDKDTPLLDAVDNGHLDVVKLLLDAGVNPRKANVNGEEPLDRATEDIDNCDEIRAALIEAKKKIGERRFTSEEHRHETDDLRSHNSHNPDSPQMSPAPTSRRAGTVRATKTSNHLLYMPMDDKTLRQAAGRGDEENVIRILQVRETFDDPESMVAASRGGHDIILQMLLALGKANPDPAPISSAPPEHATPILAAIGQENIKIISLLLEQSSFDPTKRFNGNTYYEIARQRQGPNWKEEEDMLKKAYDNYKKSHGNKTKDKDVESRRTSRAIEASDDTQSARAHKRKLSSPSQERPKKAATGTKSSTPTTSGAASSTREEKSSQKRLSDHASSRGDNKSSTATTAKSRQRSDRSPSASNANRDTPPPSKQSTKSKKLDFDSIAVSSEGEMIKPRRKKLISGRELKDEKVREKERERESQRRASFASTKAPTPPKDSSSPRDPRADDSVADKDKARAEKHRDRDRDRARQLKKEGLKEPALGTVGEGAGKRNRLSETPPNASFSDKDTNEAPIKRRKLEVDNGTSKERRPSKGSAPPDDTSKVPQKRRDDDDRKTPSGSKTKKRDASSDGGRQDSARPSVSPIEKSIHVKSEDVDVEMADVTSERRSSSGASAGATAGAEATRQKEEDKKKKAEAKAQALAAEAKTKEEEAQRRRRQEEEEEMRQKEENRKKEEEKRKREEAEEEARLKEEAEKKKKKELEDKKKREDEEKQKQRKKLEEEERRRKEEEEKKRLEEEEKEKKRREEEEERKRKFEEEERRKREEEEERLRQEQLEKEAAEEARRKLEEEERRKRERQEQERILAEKKAAEELRRRQLEEEERVRVSKLPPALQWLSLCANPKLPATAQFFKTMQGVRYDCINTDATGSAEGREQWLVNTQVALILGEKDLTLSQFSLWSHIPASMIAKQVIWRLESDRYSLTDPDLYDLGRQLPGYYDGRDPKEIGTQAMEKLRREAWEKFAAMDMFFVKVSDVMKVVSVVPHLRDVRLAVAYRELPEKESQLLTFAPTYKWKSDPNADENLGFAPGTKYFVNGILVGQHRPGRVVTFNTPPPDVRVPRRGLVAVPVDDPEFAPMCKSMNIEPMIFPAYAAFVARQHNGVLASSKGTPGRMNGTAHLNGNNGSSSAHATTPHGNRPARHTVNGINGTRADEHT